MNKRQVGDEAAVRFAYVPMGATFRVGHCGTVDFVKIDEDHATAGTNMHHFELSSTCRVVKLPATVPPEDETTLPTTDVSQPKRPPIFHREIYAGGDFHAVAVYRKSESDALFEAIEAERDALKVERDNWAGIAGGNAGEIEVLRTQLAAMTEDRNLWQDAHNDDCPNKAALDAVGQETPQEAWERGYDAGTMAAHNWIEDEDEGTPQQEVVEGIRKAIICMEAPPYTPPLKAGQ